MPSRLALNGLVVFVLALVLVAIHTGPASAAYRYDVSAYGYDRVANTVPQTVRVAGGLAGSTASSATARLGSVFDDLAYLYATNGTTSAVGSGNAYSVAHETQLAESSYPGLSRGAHFQEANTNLLAAMDADSAFAQAMDDLIPGVRDQLVRPRSISRQPPTDWTWHHAAEPGVMQLVPRVQHTAAGVLQQLFHPGGVGGYSIWGRL